MKNALRKIFRSVLFLPMAGTLYGQSDSTAGNHFDDMSLKELLDMKIVSVSKNPELWFDAPLSASVISREEMRRAGCRSIMEGLRLVPGIIVREQSNGNYDIHLRGLDNVPPNASFDMASTTMLVMIDNRPIYSYLRGGTFWETLPVDLNDVERIEVIRGPAAALYGPNAVNGVINIITRQHIKKGWFVVTNNQAGSNQTYIHNASVGYRFNKMSVIASGNYQSRERSQRSYFEFYRNTSFTNPDYLLTFAGDTIRNVNARYPDPELAMNKQGANIFLSYDPSNEAKFNINAGVQRSRVQKVAAENKITPLSTAASDTRYIDFRTVVKGFTGQLSYNSGVQNVNYDPGNKFDFHTVDAIIEYNYTKGNFSLKPGISYRKAVYDDSRYSDTSRKTGIFNARGELTTKSGMLRAEYKLLNDKLRLVAGIAANKFNYPDTTYLSYELAATYKLNANHLVRAVYSISPRSSNIFDTYVDQTVAYIPYAADTTLRILLEGNKNLKLLTAHMLEIGYRGNLNSNWSMDAELFNIWAENTSSLITHQAQLESDGTQTIINIPYLATNLPLKIKQRGMTLSLNYTTKKLHVRSFATFQQTTLKDYSPISNMPGAGMGPGSIYSGIGTSQRHKGTPAVFGGASVNYIPVSKLNLNLNCYYYSSQTYYHYANSFLNDGIRGIDHIDAKLILNAGAAYEAIKGLRIFCNAKNILNDKSREFFRTDEVPFRILAGFNYEL